MRRPPPCARDRQLQPVPLQSEWRSRGALIIGINCLTLILDIPIMFLPAIDKFAPTLISHIAKKNSVLFSLLQTTPCRFTPPALPRLCPLRSPCAAFFCCYPYRGCCCCRATVGGVVAEAGAGQDAAGAPALFQHQDPFRCHRGHLQGPRRRPLSAHARSRLTTAASDRTTDLLLRMSMTVCRKSGY